MKALRERFASRDGLFLGLGLTTGLVSIGLAVFAQASRFEWMRATFSARRVSPYRLLAYDALPVSLTIFGLLLAALAIGYFAFRWMYGKRVERAPLERWVVALVVIGVIASGSFASYRYGYRMLFAMAEDFPSYYFAGAAVWQGADPYDGKALQRLSGEQLYDQLVDVSSRAALPPPRSRFSGPVFPYLYPPLTAVLFAPYSALGYAAAQQLWVLGNLLALALLALSGIRLARGSPWAIGVACLLVVLFEPLSRNAYTAQVNLWVALLAWLTLEFSRKRPWLAGAMLGLAAQLKFSPVLLVALFVVKRNWKLAGATAMTILLLFVLTWAAGGGDMVSHFVGSVMPQYSTVGKLILPSDLRPEALVLPNNDDPVRVYYEYPKVRVHNQAPMAFSGMLFTKLGWRGDVAVRVTQLLLVGLWLLTLWAAHSAAWRDPAAVFSCAVVLVLLTAPIVWQHHLVWMIVPFVYAADRVWRVRAWGPAALIAVALALTANDYDFFAWLGLPRDVPFAYAQLAGLFVAWGGFFWLGRFGAEER